MGGPAGSRADVARLLRGILSRLADSLFSLLVLAGLAYIDLLQHRQWYVTVPAVMALAGVVIYRRELAALLRPVLPKLSLARATLFRLAIAAAGLSYFLARGRGPLSLREAYLVALPVVGLGLALAALGKWLDKALGVVYRVRDRVLHPRVREVAAAVVAWVAVFTLARPSRSSLTQHDVSGVLNAALISVAAVYLLLREPGVGHVGLAEMLGGIRWLPRKRGVRFAVSLVVLGAVTAALTYPLWRPGPGPVAAPDYILDQARRLGFDADRIAAFVRDDVQPDEYEGVLRGPVGTLWAGAGNEFDRALLLEALLDRSGIPNRLVQGETVGVEIQSEGGEFRYVGPSLSSDPASTPIELPESVYHVTEVVLRTWSPDGSSVTEESIAFRTADLIARDIRIAYRDADLNKLDPRSGEVMSSELEEKRAEEMIIWRLRGEEAAHPRLASDGSLFFSQGSNLTLLDPRTYQVTTWDLEAELNGVAVDDSGAVWTVWPWAGGLMRLDPTSGEVLTWFLEGEPAHLASDGRHIFAHVGGVIIVADSERPGAFVNWKFDGDVGDLQVAADGKIYFTDPGTNSVGVLDRSARTVTRWPVPTPESELNGVYLDEASGDVFFTEIDANKIGRLDPEGGEITEWALPRDQAEPLHLKGGTDGRIYVTARSANSLFALDPSLPGAERTVKPTVVAVEPENVTRELDEPRTIVEPSTYEATRLQVSGELRDVGGIMELSLPVHLGGRDFNASPHDFTPDAGYVALEGGAIAWIGSLDVRPTPGRVVAEETRATVAVVSGNGRELVSGGDAATARRQEVVFRLSGPGTETIERGRELFTRAFEDDFPSVFHPTNRYSIVVTAGWVPAWVREREAKWANDWENQSDAAAHRVGYSFLSLSDENTRSMMAETGVSARFESPRVTVVSDEAIPGAGTRSLSLDLRKNDIAVEGDPPGIAFSSLRSLYDASLESFVLRRETGQPATSAADVLANAFGELGSTPSERQLVLRDALARLLSGEPEGASLTVVPEGRDRYFIRFERKGSGLVVSASEAVQGALPEDAEEVRSLFDTPVGATDDLGAVVRNAEFALVASAGLPVNYVVEYAYLPPPPARWYEGTRIFEFGGPQGELDFEFTITQLEPDVVFEATDYWDQESESFWESPLEATVVVWQQDLEDGHIVTWEAETGYDSYDGRTFYLFSRRSYAELKRTGTTVIRYRSLVDCFGFCDQVDSDPVRLWVVAEATRPISVNNAVRRVPVLVLAGDYETKDAPRPKDQNVPDLLSEDGTAVINKFVVLDDPDYPLIMDSAVMDSGEIQARSVPPGRVVDSSTDSGIPNATVTLGGSTTTTWPDGSLTSLPFGESFGKLPVSVEAPGYEPLHKTIDFGRPDVGPLELRLDRLPPTQRLTVIDRSNVEFALPALDLSDRSKDLIRAAIAVNGDVSALVPQLDTHGTYGGVDGWIEVNTRTGETYPRLEDGLYGTTQLPPDPRRVGGALGLGYSIYCLFLQTASKVDEIAASIDSEVRLEGPRGAQAQPVLLAESYGSQSETFESVGFLLRGYRGLVFGPDTFQEGLRETSSLADLVSERASAAPFFSTSGSSGSDVFEILRQLCSSAPGRQQGPPIPPVIVAVPRRRKECQCELNSVWRFADLEAGLAYPRVALTLPWAKTLPLRAEAYGVHRLRIICMCHMREDGGPMTSLSSSQWINIPSRVEFEWEIVRVESLSKGRWPNREEFPAHLPRGEFRERRGKGLGWKDEGEQVLYQHPYLEDVGDVAFVTMRVIARDRFRYKTEGEGYRYQPYQESVTHGPESVTFEIRLTFKRETGHELLVNINAPAPPKKPSLGPEPASGKMISLRWDNPSPIEEVIVPALDKVATKERVKLRASARDADRLAIWCEHSGCSSKVDEFPLDDVLDFTWSAERRGKVDGRDVRWSGGTFPAGNVGREVVYEAPATSGVVTIKLKISDDGVLYPDEPVEREIQLQVVRQPVVVVPGILASRLRYRGKTIWPPRDKPHHLKTFFREMDQLGNLGTPEITVDGLLDEWDGFLGELRMAGFTVYDFPYDWRQDNSSHTSSGAFPARISSALSETSAESVDIVCHSMGGLVTRWWLRSHPEQARSVGKVLFMATPHHGAPLAYRLLKGMTAEDLEEMSGRLRFGWYETRRRAVRSGIYSFASVADRMQPILRSWPSVYQLLPWPSWFKLADYVVDEQATSPTHPDRSGPLPDWESTYVSNPDTALANPEHVRHAALFWSFLGGVRPPTESFAVVGLKLDTPIRFTLRDVWTTVQQRGTEVRTFAGYSLEDERETGDETVPALSASWEGSAQKSEWDRQVGMGRPGIYYLDDAVHYTIMQYPKAQDFVLYVLENLG